MPVIAKFINPRDAELQFFMSARYARLNRLNCQGQALNEFRALREIPKNLKVPEMVAALVILLWLLLLVVSWPLALAALLVLPILWFISIPFRIVFWAIEALLRLVKSILFLPLRILGLIGLAARKS